MIQKCSNFLSHCFKWAGSFRVPVYRSYSDNMPKERDGTIKYNRFVCKICGAEYNEEETYSFRSFNNIMMPAHSSKISRTISSKI